MSDPSDFSNLNKHHFNRTEQSLNPAFRICAAHCANVFISVGNNKKIPVVSADMTSNESNIFPCPKKEKRKKETDIMEQQGTAVDCARFCQMPRESFCIIARKIRMCSFRRFIFFLALIQFMMVITGRKRCLKDLLSASLIRRPAAFLLLCKHG